VTSAARPKPDLGADELSLSIVRALEVAPSASERLCNSTRHLGLAEAAVEPRRTANVDDADGSGRG
jgi:hypothetical protein